MITLVSFGTYLAWVGAALACFLTGMALYMRITPYDEIRLIRAGNRAAAVALGGTMIGLALPIASVLMHATSLLDLVIWSATGVLVQVIGWWMAARFLSDLRIAINEDRLSHGITLAALSFAIGLLNAGAMST